MAPYLMKNGEVHCSVLPSTEHPLPSVRENCWHDCTVVTSNRIEARPADLFAIVMGESKTIPFIFSRCRIAVDGWEVEGKVLW